MTGPRMHFYRLGSRCSKVHHICCTRDGRDCTLYLRVGPDLEKSVSMCSSLEGMPSKKCRYPGKKKGRPLSVGVNFIEVISYMYNIPVFLRSPIGKHYTCYSHPLQL